MKMDRNSSDHSPTLSENVGGSWMQCWENEFSSLTGLSLDRSSELHKLVEDKEIAARAVAFVVNSSRKGIVPLCADVAHLMRAKKSLECKLLKTRGENEILRRASASGSAQTSHSASPTPLSVHSFTDRRSLQDQSSQTEESSRPYSSCSQSSSIASGSPRLSKFQKVGSPQSRQKTLQHLAYIVNNNNNDVNQTVVTKAEVHISKNGMCADSVVNIEHDFCDDVRKRHPVSRKNSLPEIVSQPCGNVPKVSPRAIKCKGIQCTLLTSASADSAVEEQIKETLKLNSKLSEELRTARKEIEVLKGQLKELEMNSIARQFAERFYMENECEGTSNGQAVHSDDDHYFLPVIQKPTMSRSSPRTRTTKRSFSCPFTLPGPLADCRCEMCEALVQTGNTEIKLKNGLDKKCVASSLQIRLNDYIVVKGKRTGHVRYIGHLDNIGQPNAVFVGLELDAPVGRHDGSFDGKRYFECEKDHGIFLPLQEVICIVRQQKKDNSSVSEVCKKRSFKEERGKKPDLTRQSRLDSDEGLTKTEVSKLLTSSKADSGHSVKREENGSAKIELNVCGKADREKMSCRKGAEGLSRRESEKEKLCRGDVERLVRRDTDKQGVIDSETSSKSNMLREVDKHLRKLKKSSSSPNQDRRERQRTLEKRRAHDAIPLNRDLSITDGQLV